MKADDVIAALLRARLAPGLPFPPRGSWAGGPPAPPRTRDKLEPKWHMESTTDNRSPQPRTGNHPEPLDPSSHRHPPATTQPKQTQATTSDHSVQAVTSNHRHLSTQTTTADSHKQPFNHFMHPTTTFTTITAAVITTTATTILLQQ